MIAACVAAITLVTACSSGAPDGPDRAAPTAPTSQSTAPAPTLRATPEPEPARFEAGRAMRTVRHLAGEIGPRLATGPAFREAADWVTRTFEGLGYDVRRQSFPVPAGDSWGVPVGAGRSANVIATSGDFDAAAPYHLVGAHLDTVAVAPGAEDNASGVAVLLELARVLAGRGQVVLVAFGGEEPRGPGDLHHFGSTAYVAAMSPAQRRLLRGMVSLDRVGVGELVPLSSVEGTPTGTRDRLDRVADRLGVPARTETDAASDHESFADRGLPAARVGSTPYAGYHSAADVVAVVDPRQLQRVGDLLTTWLPGS